VWFAVVDGVELTVKPFQREHYQPLGEAMVFTCQLELTAQERANDGADLPYTIQWFDRDSNREITDRTGRSVFPSFFRLPFQPVSRRISQSFHSFEERAAVCACLYMPGCPVCIVKLLRII